MNKVDEGLQSSVLDFSARYLGRELSDPERARLDALVSEWARLPRQASAHVDETLRESRESMNETLDKASEIARSQVRLAGAGADAETHVLARLLEKARSLSDLRPSHLSTGQNGGQSHLVMAQIADRLANLVKQEVELRFQERFGPLAAQVEHALVGLGVARASGAPAAPPNDKSAAEAPGRKVSPVVRSKTKQEPKPKAKPKAKPARTRRRA